MFTDGSALGSLHDERKSFFSSVFVVTHTGVENRKQNRISLFCRLRNPHSRRR